MAMDIQKIVDKLDGAQQSAIGLIETLSEISKAADSFGGAVSTTIPGNIQKDIEIIKGIIDGPENNSLAQLIEWIKNLPIKDVLPAKITTTTLNVGNSTMGVGSPVDQFNTTPNMGGGTQSAIVGNEMMEPTNESALSAYLKQGRLKEQKAKYIANTINLGQTLSGIQNDSPYGQSMNEMVSPDLHYDLDKLLEGNPNAMAIGANFDNSLKSSIRRVASDKSNYQRMHEGEAPAEVPAWRQAASSVHLNESHNDFDGMFGGAAPKPMADRGALVENMSFDDIFAGGIADGKDSVHVIDNLYNK